ncbi:thioesterase domain-containing protein [Shewanella sp. OMA3-2]|uniref:thioesterase domain-containing protein n=1 Tax=Shewanella sp. OMA3-2 TaxID=2908650 RepID=UPI001F35466F|nr:thioesterase domain-containing protein [Shewanella sp. OMA3-2]UJF22487.1 thioesterase domain-containing protein [Shewanella sp. OMA3-2]
MTEHQRLVEELVATWYRTIPLSQFMQVEVLAFTDTNNLTASAADHQAELSLSQVSQLITTAPLAPNINLHQTMFAGSIYTLMTLTGWGMVWLQQQLASVKGDIVLADAQVKYIAPVHQQPSAKVIWPALDLSPLARGRRVKVELTVELWCDDVLCARFCGVYVSLPSVV